MLEKHGDNPKFFLEEKQEYSIKRLTYRFNFVHTSFNYILFVRLFYLTQIQF